MRLLLQGKYKEAWSVYREISILASSDNAIWQRLLAEDLESLLSEKLIPKAHEDEVKGY